MRNVTAVETINQTSDADRSALRAIDIRIASGGRRRYARMAMKIVVNDWEWN